MTLEEAITLVSEASQEDVMNVLERVEAEYQEDDAELVIAWLAETAALTAFEQEITI
jgi:hypothetical protein